MRLQLLLVSSVALLFSFGLLMVFNTTSAEMIDRFLDAETHAPLLRQIMYGILGAGVGFIAYRVGYESLIRFSPFLCLGLATLLLLVFVPGIGHAMNGSRRWLNFFGYTFQPSECLKVVIPLTYIYWYLRQKKEVEFASFLKMLCFLMTPIVLVLLEPDNGTTIILFMGLIVLFFLSRIRFLYWAVPLFVIGVIGIFAAYQMPYVKSRIQVYLHPELDLRGKGHQPHQAKIAAGSGQCWGRGLGESLQKLSYLPEARSDYIAAIYAEEMGFVGVVGLIVVYGVFTFSGIAVALKSKDREGFLLAATLTFLVSIQAFLNLGIVSGLLPSKGTTLPFFSQGGSSLLVNWVILFLLLDISRKSTQESYV